MQVFVVGTPLETAQALDPKRLRSQINECKVIAEALYQEWLYSKGFISLATFSGVAYRNHPITLMYKLHGGYLEYYRLTLESFKNGSIDLAKEYNEEAIKYTPDFLTPEFLDQHKRRLYTKNPTHYAQWAELGTSDVNVYFVNGEYISYCNGKRI